MDFLEKITTQFTRGRISETVWANRSYIADLYQLERFVIKRGPHSTAEGMAFKTLTSKYPVEYECIKKELAGGETTSPEEFNSLRQKWELQRVIEAEASKEQEIAREKHRLEQWLKAGGRQ